MRNIRIYSPEPLVVGASLDLPESAARHIAQVLRLTAGSELTLFDGSGLEYTGIIESATKSRVTVRLGVALSGVTESALRICLWHGLCRSDRMDSVIQKATELGVTEFQPVITERDVVRLDVKRATRKLEHWRGIAISACEQSGRVRLPLLHPVATLGQCLQAFAANQNSAATALMFDPEGTPGLRRHLLPQQDVFVLTGPEGGFSAKERAVAQEAGFSLVSLGPRILRTETAPVVILSVVQSTLGDLDIG